MTVDSWKNYRESSSNARLRYTLEALGLPEFFFVLRNPATLTPAEMRESSVNDVKEMAEIEGMQRVLYRSETALIVAWNLTDPETGEILSPPAEDVKVLERLPMEVLYEIKDAILDAYEKVPPKKVMARLSRMLSPSLSTAPNVDDVDEQVEAWKRETSQHGSAKSDSSSKASQNVK